MTNSCVLGPDEPIAVNGPTSASKRQPFLGKELLLSAMQGTLKALTSPGILISAFALALLFSLAACGAQKTEVPTNVPSTVVAPVDISLPPNPAPAEWKAYIAALNDIDPDIIGTKSEQTMVDRGRNQCVSIRLHPDDMKELVRSVNYRFTAPGYPGGFGDEKSEAILAAVRKYICPSA